VSAVGHRTTSLAGGIGRSLRNAIGDVAFGMEDGAVSTAGLVFGVAAATSDGRFVLLAGSAGALAGAVSMMVGTYFNAQSGRDRLRAMRSDAAASIAADPAHYRERAEGRLVGVGFTDTEAATFAQVLSRNQAAMLDWVAAFDLKLPRGDADPPFARALWMFVADLFAASTPVIPFALLPISTARIVSLAITALLLVCLGAARARVARRRFIAVSAQTLGMAGAAALAGVAVARIVMP
jgi:VIT1/CCC1 family predicted Fe2+/Mn2+ transporter